MLSTPAHKMNPLRAVIFDFFGTLVPNFTVSGHKDVLRGMARALGAPTEGFLEHWLASFEQRATGVFPDVRSNIEAVCRIVGVLAADSQYETARRLRFDFEKQHTVPRPTAIQTLKSLRASGIKTGLISDCSTELPAIWPSTAFAALFDTAVFSCQVKMRKPNPEIYLHTCRLLEVEPTQCLYVGDGGSRELSGARAVGMMAVLLAAAEEQNNANTHRVDGEEWTGPRIYELQELLGMLKNNTGMSSLAQPPD